MEDLRVYWNVFKIVSETTFPINSVQLIYIDAFDTEEEALLHISNNIEKNEELTVMKSYMKKV